MHWKRKLAKEIAELERGPQTSSARSKLSHLRRKMISNKTGVNQQSKKKRCPQGHKYTKKNTYILKSGARRCAICHRKSSMDYFLAQKKAKKKLAKAA